MSHTLTTVIAPLARERVESARTLIDALGNPASEEVRLAMKPLSGLTDSPAVHFLSVNAFAGQGERGYLVLELSGDGQEQELLNGVATCIPALTKIFALASDRGHSSLTSYWKAHVVKVGNGYFSNPGLGFAGAPGFSVRRILLEARVATHVMQRLEVLEHRESSALARLEKIRGELPLDSSFKEATVFETAPVLETERPLTFSLGLRILWSFVRTYLWPGVLPVVAVFLLGLFGPFPAAGFRTGLRWSWWTAVTTVVLGIAAAIAAYRTLRGREDRDASHDLRADPDTVRRIVEREDRTTQNHLASLYEMKPGKLRRFTVRLAFFLIGELASRHFRPGFLGALGTIHFARWVMVRGTGDLFFFSNYSGSWESYLEDFITRANRGLTAVWSNTRDFPRTVNLFELGASDGARFKRWARRWQIPTGFWYSAYPDLSTAAIRRNAAIRQGLAHARTEEEAARWMTLFGSETRPASALEMNEIQSLVFGGLGFLPSGLCLGFRFSGSGDRAKQWLQELLNSGMVAFGDGRKRIETNGAAILGFGPKALRTLGLDTDAQRSFPQAFIDGMCAPWRSLALGDIDKDAPERWIWGGPSNAVDGVLLLYAPSDKALVALRDAMRRSLEAHGHNVSAQIRFKALEVDSESGRLKPSSKSEPFGFRDGISQPVIRGTYKSLRNADPIHIVEAGEFILGYPDNRGYLPATATLQAVHDPARLLSITASPQLGFERSIRDEPRDIGRNGTFLVIRQLEQEVEAFHDYCAAAANQVRERFHTWSDVNKDFVGAKLLGRWPDGSSIVRYPYRSGTASHAERHPQSRTAAGAATANPASVPPSPTPVDAAGPAVRRMLAAGEPVDIKPDNDFLFGAEDPQGIRCPLGAHVRRANPRDSQEPNSKDQLAISNRHRILRVGRVYEPEPEQKPGLFFMCLNAEIERQFEFVQQTWLQHGSFHGLPGERDPLVGCQTEGGAFTLPTREGPVRLKGLPSFVNTLGGGYFFVPGRRFLTYLAKPGIAS